MKRAVIGGFLTLIGTIWDLAVIIFVGNNLVSGWSTPPGRFLTTVSKTGMTLPMVVGTILFVLGLLIMKVEFFRKE